MYMAIYSIVLNKVYCANIYIVQCIELDNSSYICRQDLHTITSILMKYQPAWSC